MTFDLTSLLHPGDLIYQVAFVVDPENLSDGSNWKIVASLVVFFAMAAVQKWKGVV